MIGRRPIITNTKDYNKVAEAIAGFMLNSPAEEGGVPLAMLTECPETGTVEVHMDTTRSVWQAARNALERAGLLPEVQPELS